MDPNTQIETQIQTTTSTEPDLAGFLTSLGVTQNQEPAPDVADPAKPDADVTPTEEPKPKPESDQELPKDNKAAQAFAAMRVQNKMYNDSFKDVAKLLGINDADPAKIVEAIRQKATEQAATEQHVPVELLQRLQTLEAENQKHQQEETEKNAFLGFQRLKDRFQLDDTALQQFAAELSSNGLNPFEKPVNVEQEYLFRHFDALMQAAEERGKQAEIARSLNAQQHTSTALDKEGNPLPDSEKINSVAGLTNFFKQASTR